MKKSVLLSAAALVAFQSHGAWAQTTEGTKPTASGENTAQNSGTALEEIVVTAQKRSENLQDVPIAVTAVSSGMLAKAGVKSFSDLTVAVPGLNVTNTYGRLTLSLRGVGSTSVNPGFENPIALYIDGVYYASSASSLLSLNNINQIEVLKGPQGTLFGRNATGGLLNVTTKEPTQTPTGAFNLTYANYQTVIGSSYISGGLTDDLAADLAVYAKHQGAGWGKQLSTGKHVYGVDHDISVRSKLVFTPSTTTKFTLIGDYENVRDTMLATNLRHGSISPFLPGVQPDPGYNTNANVLPQHYIKSGGASLRWDQGIGDLKLSSITAYRQSRSLIGGDEDGLQQQQSNLYAPQFDKQFSQEFQLGSASGQKLKWTAGLFYFAARAGYLDVNQTLNYAGIQYLIPSSKEEVKSAAAYAQASYPLGDNTNVTLGARYTHETHKLYDSTFAIIGVNVPPSSAVLTVLPNAISTDNRPTWRVSIDHRFSPDIMVYASYNRGFKAGGFSVSSPFAAPFKPETLDAYEVGAKTDLFSRRARFNVSAFYYNYNNIQVLQYDVVAPITVNGAKAKSYGFDADLTANLAQGLQITGGVTWVHPTFSSYPNCVRAAPNGGVPLFSGNCSGLDLPIAPRLTLNAALDYAFDFAGGKLDLNGNIYYNSGFYTDLGNSIHQKKYAKLGTQVRWVDASDRYSITAYGTNLTNQRVIVYGDSQQVGTMLVQYAEPRTYGVTLGYKF